MKIRHWKFILTVVIFAMCLAVLPTLAHAQDTPSLELPVTITLKGLPPSDDDYEIILEADDKDYPMPEGSVDGKFIMPVKAGETVKLPRIDFTSIGIYTYAIYQPGDFVDRVYDLVVYVTSTEDGSGLETTVILYLAGEPEKLESVEFSIEGEEEPTPEEPEEKPIVPQTGDYTVIWPYVGLFLSGAALLVILGFSVVKKKEIDE